MSELTVKAMKTAIVITLPYSVLKVAAEASPDLAEVNAKVIDVEELAKDVVYYLESEEGEDGVTPVHRLFDRAFLEAFEQGSLGFADEED